MRNLQRFDNALALAFEIRGGIADGSISENAAITSIYGAITEEQHAKPSAGMHVADLEQARYAVYFFIDELLLDIGVQSKWTWYTHSLQRRFLESDRGGELFYTYFEQALDRLLLIMPIDTQSLEQKSSKAQILADDASLSLTEKFRHVIQSASCLNAETPTEITSKLSMLATYAQCLLFGFRGKYYDTNYDDMRKKLRTNAQIFLGMTESETNKMPFSMPQHPHLARPQNKQKLWSYFFYATCPLAVCLIWYFYCAETITQGIL